MNEPINNKLIFEPLYKSYSNKEVIGSLCHISKPKMTIGYKNNHFWGSARNGGITTPIEDKQLHKIVKEYGLDISLPKKYNDFSQK